MSKLFHLEMITPERRFFDGRSNRCSCRVWTV